MTDRVRDMCEVLLCLSCHAASIDMKHGPSWSFIRSGHLPWPQIWEWPFGVKRSMFLCCMDMCLYNISYVSMRLDAENAIALSIFLYFRSSKAICENVDITKKATFLFGLPWKGQNIAYGNKKSYSWIQNIPNLHSFFMRSILIRVRMSWGWQCAV